jgi:serine O-acetyltransferase
MIGTRSKLQAASLSFEQGKPLATGDEDENPEGVSLLELIREDFRTHGSDLRSAGFWALCVHRVGNARMRIKNRVVRAPVSLAYRTAYQGVIAMFGIEIPYNVKIGRRLRIGHHGCFVLGARVVGDDVHFHHSATVGLARRSERSSAPVIGDRVEIGPGACIVGSIEVGDDCYVGANTVLADTLPPGTTVIGVPARVVQLETLTAPKPPADPQR